MLKAPRVVREYPCRIPTCRFKAGGTEEREVCWICTPRIAAEACFFGDLMVGGKLAVFMGVVQQKQLPWSLSCQQAMMAPGSEASCRFFFPARH